METLLHIDAPHFCAGAVVSEGKITRAAPIIHYMKGWKPSKAESYCQKRGWKFVETGVSNDFVEF